MSEKHALIPYQGNQISFFSDERADYVNLTDMANAWRNYGRKSIPKWIQNRQTIEFLCAWEKKHNVDFADPQMGPSPKDNKYTSIQVWIEKTQAIGVFSRVRGSNPGTWAHKDIAIRFAGWLSPEFELYLIEEIQKLKKIEEKVNSYELLSYDQILYLTRLKEVFKYVAHQEFIEDAHKEVYASQSNSKNPFAEFNVWRNKILDIEATTINERIKQYCIENKISIKGSITKRNKILILDTYESVRNAVWDFLQIKGEANALNLANLVGDMIRTEKGEVLRVNEDNLFQKKQNLGEFTDFYKQLAEMPEIKTARQFLEYKQDQKKQQNNLSSFNQSLKKALDFKPKDTE